MFQQIFTSKTPARDKFLSRVFGIFSEEIVRCWCSDDQAPYTNLGRPTIRESRQARGYSLDFTFQSKTDNLIYVGEMKCELELANYRYLVLKEPEQLTHHLGKEAFRLFLDLANTPQKYVVTRNGKPQNISGAILVWGSCTDEGRKKVLEQHGFRDILSLESIVADLVQWKNKNFLDLLAEREAWVNEMFSGLRGIEKL